MDKNIYFPKGKTPSPERFEFIAAALLGAVAAFLFLFVRISVINGVFGYDTADKNALYIAAGAVSAAGSLALGALLFVARGGRIPSALSLIGGALICVGCLLDAIFSVLRRGSFHMSIQSLYFVLAVVLTGVLALALYGSRGAVKTVIASVSVTAVALVAAFIPLMTGDSDLADVFSLLATPLSFGVIALACFGFRNGTENERTQD